jgi:gamma-glutamylcyclotransferase (GGCT)/AIG2-like uncharacterized protein YtfP
MKVFVYGTLKRGCGNHHLLKDAVFVGEAVTVETFGMVDVGFPFMLREQHDTHPVAGELYDIGDDRETLAALDRLENEGFMYDRVTGYVWCGSDHHLASYYVKCVDRVMPGVRVRPNRKGELEWRVEFSAWAS